MGRASKTRPWLATLLGLLVVGLGHLYLRRWLRALGWLALLFGVTLAFVPDEAIEAYAAGGGDPLTVAPTLAVAGLSAVDAYLLARAKRARETAAPPADAPASATATECPNCGREIDPELDFCEWCGEELNAGSSESEQGPTQEGGWR